MLQKDLIFALPIPRNEQYVDYNQKPLDLNGRINVNVEVGERKIKNVRILIARNGKSSLIGKEWLAQLQFKVEELSPDCEHKFPIPLKNTKRKRDKPTNTKTQL